MHAVEARHASFASAAWLAMLRAHNVGGGAGVTGFFGEERVFFF